MCYVCNFCSAFWQLLVKTFHLSAGKGVCMYVSTCPSCVQLSCWQDVSSFGSFSSRCSIFRRGKLCLHVCVCACPLCVQLSCCQEISSFGSFSSRWSIFRRGKLCLHVCVCATFVLSRCFVFQPLLVKMFHHSARKVVFVCVCVCALCVQLSDCRDVSSFGSFSSRCSIFQRGKLCLYVCVYAHCVCNFHAVKMFHLSAASRQDVPSSVRKVVFVCLCICIVCATFMLSKCFTFQQVLFKMFHLPARKVVYMCIVCATFMLSRCSIFRQLLVKMFRLSARTVVCMLYVCVCTCIVCATFMLPRCSIFRHFLVKMFHVLAISCQDIHFSVRKVVFHSLCMCIVFHVVKMFKCVWASFCSRGSVFRFIGYSLDEGWGRTITVTLCDLLRSLAWISNGAGQHRGGCPPGEPVSLSALVACTG